MSAIFGILILVSLFNFTFNAFYTYEFQDKNYNYVTENAFCESLKEKNVDIYISNDSVRVTNCHLLTRIERLRVLSYIKNYLVKNKIYRSINNLEAELKLHAVLYELNIYSDRTKDADLEFDEDSRWYVRTVTILFQILGI